MFKDDIYNVYLCKDGRYRAYNRETKKVTSYPRILLERKLNRELTSEEQVHHIDENASNNNIKNLEIMKLGEHQKLHSPSLPPIISKCFWCNKNIKLEGKRANWRRCNEKRGKKGPFCSQRCRGLYGVTIQKEKKLDNL